VLPLLKQRSDTSFLTKYQQEMAVWRQKMARMEDAGREPIAPQYLMAAVSELAADDAIITCDSGTIATWAARHWTIRGDRRFYLSGNLATMAPGLPYAIGIQHAFPDRQVIGFVGDGGFAMQMAEFLAAIQHGLPVKIVINNNNALGQILWEQTVLGYPEHGVRYPEPIVNYAAFASANGAFGVKVSGPGEVKDAIRQGLGHPGPAWSTWTSTRSSRRCPARWSTSRRKTSRSRSCAACRTGPRSRPRCSRTGSSSSVRKKPPEIRTTVTGRPGPTSIGTRGYAERSWLYFLCY
jgi:thiamine pyrophosphate-dependent acetolactate synthase large subunit-like protein